jgi:MtN3 and saliva related transmembrane protein
MKPLREQEGSVTIRRLFRQKTKSAANHTPTWENPAGGPATGAIVTGWMMISAEWVPAIGTAAAVLTTLCWVPQALKIILTRNTQSISLLTQTILVTGIVMWLVYGLEMDDQPLIWANIVTLGLNALILGLKLRYG